MLRAEQVQSLKRCTVESNKAIQHGGMAPDNEITIVVEVCWNVDVFCPAFVGGAEASIPLEFVQRVGEYPCCALVAVFVQHGLDAFLFQVHSIEVLTDRLLDGVAAGDVRLMALPPERQFISFIRFGR